MSANPLEAYLSDCHSVRATGANAPETSFYPALSTLFNEVGGHLKPTVRRVMGLKDQGAGMPDGGLFTESQFKNRKEDKPLPGQTPERGVIEVSATSRSSSSGLPDPSVFSAEHNREGIRKGTAISLYVRRSNHDDPSIASIAFRNFWGVSRGPISWHLSTPRTFLSLMFPLSQRRIIACPSSRSK